MAKPYKNFIMSEDVFKLPVFNINGEKINKNIDLTELKDIKFNEHLIYLAVKNYLANQRQGTHKTKERSEVNGSTRKLFRQKGTGGARRGDKKSPILRGGGTIFGPKPRDYGFKMNKNEKKLALMSLMKSKIENKMITVVDKFIVPEIKTKKFISSTEKLNLSEKKNLFIPNLSNENLYLSSRNLGNIDVKTFNFVNIYDLISASKIIFEEEAILNFVNRIKL